MDNGHLEIAKSLMVEILYENGYIDRYHSEESQISEKWCYKIAPLAGKFFDSNPELLNNENIKILANSSDNGDFNGLEKYNGFNELNEILNEYFDDGCGCDVI